MVVTNDMPRIYASGVEVRLARGREKGQITREAVPMWALSSVSSLSKDPLVWQEEISKELMYEL